MKHRTLSAGILALVTALAGQAALAADVGVSVSVYEPGFYGRIDMGGLPPPPVIYREPIVVEHVTVVREPVYLHVPPGHAKKWRKHCHEYSACGQRVLFVQDNWYNEVYVPHHHGKGRKGHGKGRDKH